MVKSADKRRMWLVVMLAAGLLAAPAGCREDRPKRKYRGPIDGIARKYDPKTGEVEMELVDPKTELTTRYTGYVTDQTEVEINGITAEPSDIRMGEPVTVEGYFEGSGQDKKFIVTRITVRRGQAIDIVLPEGGPTTAPATKPAP